MVDLAAIGRARPSRNVRDIIDVQNRDRQLDLREKLVGSRVELNTERINQMRYQRKVDAEERRRQNAPISWDQLSSTFYGGADGAMAQVAQKIGKSYNLLEDLEGETIIRAGNAEQGLKLISEGPLARQFLRAGLSDANKNISAIQQQLAEKPNDKNLTQQLEIHKMAKQDFLKRMDDLQSIESMQAEQEQAEFERDIAERGMTAEEDRLSETIRHNKAMEAAKRAEEKKKGKTDKTQENRRKDFIHHHDKAVQALLGAGTFFPMDEKQRRAIASDALKKARTLAKQYISGGGDIRDLGIEDIKDLRSLEKLPEGLTWETIEFNQKKYGKIVPEIIKAYKEWLKRQEQ